MRNQNEYKEYTSKKLILKRFFILFITNGLFKNFPDLHYISRIHSYGLVCLSVSTVFCFFFVHRSTRHVANVASSPLH